MTSKVLILCHVEELFRKHFPGDMLEQICERRSEFDHIIHMTSEIENDHPVDELCRIVDEEIVWAWGYEPEAFCEICDEPAEHNGDVCLCADCGGEPVWVTRTQFSAHEWTWIPPEMRNGRFKNAEVFLGGGYDGECLADMEEILKTLGVPFRRVEEFIYP